MKRTKIAVAEEIRADTIPFESEKPTYLKIETVIPDNAHCARSTENIVVQGLRSTPWYDRARPSIKNNPFVDASHAPAKIVPFQTSRRHRRTVHSWLFPSNITTSTRTKQNQVKEHCLSPTVKALNLESGHNFRFHTHGFGVFLALSEDLFYAAVTTSLALGFDDLHCVPVNREQFQALLLFVHLHFNALSVTLPRLLSPWTIGYVTVKQKVLAKTALCSSCKTLNTVPFLPDMPTCFEDATHPVFVAKLDLSPFIIQKPSLRLLHTLYELKTRFLTNWNNEDVHLVDRLLHALTALRCRRQHSIQD